MSLPLYDFWEQTDEWHFRNLIFRMKEDGPIWFKNSKLEVPTTTPYFEITIRAFDKVHSGWCSGAEEEDCETTAKTVVCYVMELGDIEVGYEWNYALPCRNGLDTGYGSGYCQCSDSVAEVVSVEKIE